MSMEDVTWTSEYPHSDNSHTMSEYLYEFNMLDIELVDGSYAEGVDCSGDLWAIRAMGGGDSFSHRVTFEKL